MWTFSQFSPKGRAFCMIDHKNIFILGEKDPLHTSPNQLKYPGFACLICSRGREHYKKNGFS
ncbi:BnaAnng05170D [Brassica napus]|uniref:BnaAnng05170D protein n=1 Tax=Brassica napus TaxID=3708 RepID=A0A078HJK1_BRANA|nr:BnaAnng05170D [Brassica napus]